MPNRTLRLLTRAAALSAALVLCVGVCRAQQQAAATSPMPMRGASLSCTHVAFEYAGDLWAVGREGGDARRLTDYPDKDQSPFYSPDGSRLA